MSTRKLLFISILIFSKILFAQDNIKEIEQLLSAEKLKQANELIVTALKLDSNNSKLWFYKGLIIQQKIEISSPSNIKKQILDSAFYCYKLAEKYDTKRILESLLAESLLSISQQYAFTGMELFNNKEYTEALNVFEKCISISKSTIVNHLDTMAFYSAAMAAEEAKIYPKAEYYYSEIVKFYPLDWNSIIALANIYKLQGEKDLYLKLLKQNNRKYPEIEIFYKELVGYYLEVQNTDSAMLYLDKVLRISNNDKLLYLKGSVLQNENNIEAAKLAYYKCLEINPRNADVLYNLAAIEYNRALDLVNKEKLTSKEKKELKQYLHKSVEYLVLIKTLEPNNKNILLMLNTCYHQLGMKVEEKEITKELERF